MRFLWTLVKFVLLLAIAIPLAIIVLSVSLGILGAVVGLAFFALRIALICLVVYGVVRLGMSLFGIGRAPKTARPAEISRPPVDPYYEAARRELDLEIPEAR
jgi:hypothetical protein